MFSPMFYELNPFLLSLLLLIYLFVRRCRNGGDSSSECRRGVRCLAVLLLLNVVVFVSLEMYFHLFRCRVSSNYSQKNLFLLRRVISLFNARHILYWLDFGTLLSQLRQEAISPWDHDSDLSLLDLSEGEDVFQVNGSVIPSIELISDYLEEKDFFVSYDSSRHYLQVWMDPVSRRKGSGPHLDLWFWIPRRQSDGSIGIHSLDLSIAFNPRPLEQIFPLKNITWLNLPSFIPQRAKQIAEEEYRHYPGDSLQSRTFRKDCFHNFFERRFLY